MTETSTLVDTISDALVQSGTEALATFSSNDVVAGVPVPEKAKRCGPGVLGCVGLAGQVTGVVTVWAEMKAARQVATAMMAGMAPEGDEETADVIGEVTNLVAGLFRAKMALSGRVCDISVPSVTIGSTFFTKYGANATCIACPITFDGDTVYVEASLV